jgi:hypothetical protein
MRIPLTRRSGSTDSTKEKPHAHHHGSHQRRVRRPIPKGTHLPRTAAEHQELDLEAWKTWEAGDDSGLAEAGTAWARHLRRKLRKATTELRWGMVDFDRSE